MSYLSRFFVLALLSFSFSLSAGGNDSLTLQPTVRYEDVFDRSEWEFEFAKDMIRSSFKAVLTIAKLPGYSAAALVATARSANRLMREMVEHLQEPYLDYVSDEGDGASDLLQEADSLA